MRRPYRARHHFVFSRNPYHQLICLGCIRVILSLFVFVCGFVANQNLSYLHFTHYLYWSACIYITSAFLSLLSGWSQNRWAILVHFQLTVVCCLILYPTVMSLAVVELWCDTGCRCNLNTCNSHFNNWNAVPLEVITLTVATIIFIFNLLAAVNSCKLWRTLQDARLYYLTTMSMRQLNEQQAKIFSCQTDQISILNANSGCRILSYSDGNRLDTPPCPACIEANMLNHNLLTTSFDCSLDTNSDE